MDINCFDDLDRDDQKGGIQGGAHRTAAYLDGRCRYGRPSGPVNTPSERVSTNILVERGVECGPALQTSVAPKIVPVANPTTGNSSTLLSLNPSKTEFLVIGLPKQLEKLNHPTIHLPNDVILPPVDSARNLGVISHL